MDTHVLNVSDVLRHYDVCEQFIPLFNDGSVLKLAFDRKTGGNGAYVAGMALGEHSRRWQLRLAIRLRTLLK